MNSQAPIIMSAAEAWPRRPPGTRTRPDRSPTLNGDSSSAGGDSSFPSPALGSSSPALAAGAVGGNAFGPRLDLPASSAVQLVENEERKEIKYRHEGTRLDPVKLRGIASAFGMAISTPPAKLPAAGASSPPAVSHPSSSSLVPPTSASTHSRGGASSTSSASSSVSSFPPASPFADPRSLGTPAAGPSPARATTGGHLLSVQAPPYLSSSPVLLPLLPSLKSQIAAIARDFGLPSTVGLVLFLVYENGAGEGRLGEGVWEILWRDFFHGGSPAAGVDSELASALSDDGRPLDPSSSPSSSPAMSHAPLQRPRYGSEPLASPSLPIAGPSVARYPTSQPRQIEPSESLLSRTPSTLTPASLRARKKLARLSAKAVPVRPNGLKAAAKRSSRTPATRASDLAEPSSLAEGRAKDDLALSPGLAETSTSSPQTRLVGQRTPSSPLPGPSQYPSASPTAAFHRRPSGLSGSSKGGAISIVGTLEWDVDARGSSQWYDRWLARKNIVREPRPTGGWQAAAAAAASAPAAAVSSAAVSATEEADSDSDDEGLFAADDGYAPLSEGEEIHPTSSQRGGHLCDAEAGQDGSSADDGDKEDDSAPSDYDGPARGDPLGDVFPTDEADFFALRSARDDRAAAEELDVERPATPPPSSRPREGSVGLGLGLGLGFGLDSVEQRRQKDLDGLKLTGADLGDEYTDEPEPEQGVQEIEDLLARRTSTPRQPPAIEVPPLETAPSDPPHSKDDLPPTPLKQRRKSSARDTSDGSATASNGNPLNLTLAISSPAPSAQFPTLVTSPTSAVSPTGSDATGGLAYLRGDGGSIDSYASSGPSDGMLSAALEGAFGSSGAGKRGSALMMQDTLADLEKVVRSLSPRELKIPNRERSVAYSPGASSLSPAPSGSSFAMFPSPAFPPSAYVSPAGSPSIVPTGSSPRPLPSIGAAVGEGPSRFQSQTFGAADGNTEAQSIASSFKQQQATRDKQPPLSISTTDFAPPAWPAVPVSPGSPLLSDVALPLRKDSPFSTPRVPSPELARFEDRQQLSSTSSISSGQALGSPLSPLAGGSSGHSQTYPSPQPPAASSPLHAAFPAHDAQVDDLPQRTERSESASTTNSKASGSRFRSFGWGRAASSGSLEEGAMASSSSASPAGDRETTGGPSAPLVPRHQSIPDFRGPPPLRTATSPAGRSVSDTSALEVLSQFGQLQVTPEMSTGFQEMNFPSPPTGSVDRKSASGGKKRFRAQVNLGGLFGGKNKKQLEIAPPEIGEPMLQSSPRFATVPFHHRQRSDSSDVPTSPRLPLSPRKVSEPGPGPPRGLPPSISQSFSTRSISSAVLSPPGSPTSAMSPRSVKRKPVPGSAMGPQRDLQRSFSQDSSLSIVPSIPDAEPPLPLRTTSLGTPSTPVTPTAPAHAASP